MPARGRVVHAAIDHFQQIWDLYIYLRGRTRETPESRKKLVLPFCSFVYAYIYFVYSVYIFLRTWPKKTFTIFQIFKIHWTFSQYAVSFLRFENASIYIVRFAAKCVLHSRKIRIKNISTLNSFVYFN